MTSRGFLVQSCIVPVIFCLVLIYVGIDVLAQEISSTDEEVTLAAPELRHPRRHHRHRGQQESAEASDFVVAAYRAVEQMVMKTRDREEEEDEETPEGNGGSSNTDSSLERRLETLEQDVRSLCLEDEEDQERAIRELNVKCICPKTEAPVCGSDNHTYYNRCYLHCRAQIAATSYHRYQITLKKFGRC